MRLVNRFALPWLGVLIGLLVCGLPLMAMAVQFAPPKRGLPGRREGGGTRDPLACIQGNPSRLTAIMPQSNLGLTLAEYPRFFWYMPKTSPRVKYAEFALTEVDESLQDKVPVYTTTFRISGKPGVASLALPSDATIPPLTVGKDYRWSLAIICNPSNPKENISVNGWIQRATPDAGLAKQLATTVGDRASLYASNGLWFDTLTTLAEQRCTNPGAASASWTALMKAVKLDSIAEQPLVQQCGERFNNTLKQQL